MTSLVWLSSRRNLGWRRRRFVIAVIGITLAFALTLLLSGFRDGIGMESDRAVRALGGDTFVVRAGVSGPFTTIAQLPAAVADDLALVPGTRRAALGVSVRHAIESAPVTDVDLVGAPPGAPGAPRVTGGRASRARGEAVLDAGADPEVGDTVRLGGRSFVVVGLVRDVSVWAGVPTTFVPLGDAQDLVFAVEHVSGGQAMRPLEDLDLDARGGAAVLLSGPSGTGKTTLLSCLAAILSPAAGTIAFGDVEVTALAGGTAPRIAGARLAWSSRPSTWCPASPPSRT